MQRVVRPSSEAALRNILLATLLKHVVVRLNPGALPPSSHVTTRSWSISGEAAELAFLAADAANKQSVTIAGMKVWHHTRILAALPVT